MPWSDRVNAEEYERFTLERPLYRVLNERLVALAEIGTARRVLDLAWSPASASSIAAARASWSS